MKNKNARRQNRKKAKITALLHEPWPASRLSLLLLQSALFALVSLAPAFSQPLQVELVDLVPDVRYRKKGEFDWYKAKAPMHLQINDCLRTLQNAEAKLKFPSGDVLRVNSSSYIVIQPEPTTQTVQLIQGNIRAAKAKIIMPGGAVIQAKMANSDYQAKIRDDQSQVVFVYNGEVNVTAKGKMVTVPKGYGTEIPKASAPLEPKPLTSFKDYNPQEATAEFGSRAKSISSKNLGIQTPSGSPSQKIYASYRIQIAPDASFNSILVNRVEPSGKDYDIRQAPIPDGTYYTRVGFIDAAGKQEAFSPAKPSIKDTVPPPITNVSPENGSRLASTTVAVSGSAGGASSVTINGEIALLTPDGRFVKQVTLSEGSNEIAIVAKDFYRNETSVVKKVTVAPKR